MEELQPKRRNIDVYTKVLTINYLDRVYETVSMKEQAREYVTKEFEKYEKANGSKDSQNYQDDPEASHPPKGKRGRPALNKPKPAKDMERYMHKEIEKGFQEVDESNLISTEIATLHIKHLKTIVKEYNQRTGSNAITKQGIKQKTYESI